MYVRMYVCTYVRKYMCMYTLRTYTYQGKTPLLSIEQSIYVLVTAIIENITGYT